VSDAPVAELADRYGRPPPWRRTAVVVGSGLVGVLGLVWLAWATFFHADPEVSSQLVSFQVVDENTATARIEVVLRRSPDATCEVRAIAADHTVVGEASFVPEAGRNEVRVRTERRASAVENVGCTTPDQRRPR
jgi:hypothetical protein